MLRKMSYGLIWQPGFAGWNCSNDEVNVRDLPSCYVVFDQKGALAFQGRSNLKDIEKKSLLSFDNHAANLECRATFVVR